MSNTSSYPKLNWTSFEAPWNTTWCIAPSTTSPLENGPNASRTFPTLPNTSGALGKNCPSNLAYSSRGQGYPPELLDCTLADMHGVHQGIDRMQPQVREAVYWSGIDADIANYVHQCTICTKHKASLPTQPMLPRDVPDGPWQEIAVDYLTHQSKEYVPICDLFSKYPLLYKVFTKSAQSLYVCLLELISQ